MNREALIELKARVEAGEAPEYSVFKEAYVKTVWQALPFDTRGRAWSAYNGSLDSAKALHDAVLPDYGWLINGYRCWAHVWAEGDRQSNASFEAVCPNNPARAWLLAILSALIAQEEGSET